MRHFARRARVLGIELTLALLAGWPSGWALAQAPSTYSPEQLDRMVSRIACIRIHCWRKCSQRRRFRTRFPRPRNGPMNTITSRGMGAHGPRESGSATSP
jgi:hypothetical protein